MKKIIRNKQKGFTLVELAIVLVIIGLIVSGVLAGRDLIKAAQLRADVRQLQSYQLAVNTFIGKFNQLPGDAQGDTFGLTGACDGGDGLGDQDGLIEAAGGEDETLDGENICFWSNLTTDFVSLIPGVFSGVDGTNNTLGEHFPAMKSAPGSGWGVFTDDTDNFFITGVVGDVASDSYDTAAVYVPIDAFNIDEKIDDGVPTAGDIQAKGAGTGDPNADPVANCSTATAGGVYVFDQVAAQCTLRFKMQTF